MTTQNSSGNGLKLAKIAVGSAVLLGLGAATIKIKVKMTFTFNRMQEDGELYFTKRIINCIMYRYLL